MRAGPLLLVFACVAAAGAAAFFLLGGPRDQDAAQTALGDRGKGGDAGAGGAGGGDSDAAKRKPRAGGRVRAKAPDEFVETGDADWDAVRRIAHRGDHLEALESIVVRRKSAAPADAVWKSKERVAEIVTWEDAAIDRLVAVVDTTPRDALAVWLRRLDEAVLDPARRRRLDQLRRSLVEAGKLDLQTILDAASAQGRSALERHLVRFGGGSGGPEAAAAAAAALEPGVVDALLSAVKQRNTQPRVDAKGNVQQSVPLPVDDAAAREQRRLEQLEKLRQRAAEGLLEPIAAGLAWIAIHQADDGEMSDGAVAARCLALGHGTPCNVRGGVSGAQYRLAATGLSVLAFLDFRDQDLASVFEPTLSSGVEWLRRQIRADGSFPQQGYEAAIAMMALGQAARASKSPAVLKDVERCLAYYAGKVSSDGGFRYSLGQAGDLSVSAWYVQAFEAARDAGAKVPAGLATNLEKFVRSMWLGGPKFKYDAGRTNEQPTLAAAGMLSLSILNPESVAKEMKEGLWPDALAAASNRPRADIYAVYYEVRTELALKGQLSAERQRLLADLPRILQRKDLPVAGMFSNANVDPEKQKPVKGKANWDNLAMIDRGGRVVATAFCVLTMEHALYRR